MLIYAVTAISFALLFYTVGVWSEKIQGSLKKWHLVMFWVGFAFDTTGTTLMGKLAGDMLTINFHSVTGLAAILLMAVHAVWATAVLVKGGEKQKRSFHRFSILVWFIWLVPYISGMIFGMTH
jgi:uncharacterized repeat protein (TIGR03987 family)